MAVYWFDPCLGGGFNSTDEVCHGTTGTSKTGTYSNPFGLDEMFNTAYSNPLGLADGDEIRIKGEQDSFWWSSSTWNVRGDRNQLDTTSNGTQYYQYLDNGNGVTIPTDAFTHANGTARNCNLFLVTNTSDYNCGWDDRFMFLGGKHGTAGIGITRSCSNGAAIAYLGAASNQYKRVGNLSYGHNTASTNPEAQLKWCVKVPEMETSTSNRYWLGLSDTNVSSGGSTVDGRLVAGGVTITDGWSSETAQTSGYYSLIFAPHCHNSNSNGRTCYYYLGPISMRNSYIMGFHTGRTYYHSMGEGQNYLRPAYKPHDGSSGSAVYTSTVYAPSFLTNRFYDQTTNFNTNLYAKFADIRWGTIMARTLYLYPTYIGYNDASYQQTHTDNQQIHYERIFHGDSNTNNILFQGGYQPNNSNYITDAASASGTNGYHFGDIIMIPRYHTDFMLRLTPNYLTIRLKNNSTYCSTEPSFIDGLNQSPLNLHAGTGLTNAASNTDFTEWPYADEMSVAGPTALKAEIPTLQCPRGVIDATATNFYNLVQTKVPAADMGTQTYVAGRMNFGNADAGLFNQSLLSHDHYFANANFHTQLIFKECNLTENSGGPIVYGTSHDVDAGTARGSFAYTNSDNELVIIPNRDSSIAKNHNLFYIPTTVPDLSSASTMTTTIQWYLSNWYALSGNSETIIQIKTPYSMSAAGSLTTTTTYSSRNNQNQYPTQSSPITATAGTSVGSNIASVSSTSINPGVIYIAVGMYLADNTSLASNSRVIIKSVTITAS